MSLTESSQEGAGLRLSKRLVQQLQCSRTEAELYIENGVVQVDGLIVEHPGTRVLPHQVVSLKEGAKPTPVPPVTLLLHKPAGYSVQPGTRLCALDLLTPERWAQGDSPAPIRMLQKHFRHLECVEPLPAAASGLTVFTQDGRVARKLREDIRWIEQECVAHVEGTLDEDGLERLREGTAIAGKKLPRIKVSWQSDHHLRFALKGIYPEEIAAMCAGVGLELMGLKRLRMGSVSMAKLPEGHWRYALPWERF